MMCLSRTTGYAIQALGCMTGGSESHHQIAALAKCSGVPRAYLAKIISALSRKGLIFAKRGYRGGIYLARPAWDISLLEIVEAVEGEHWIGECLLGFEDCAHHLRCPTQSFWRRIRREIVAKLEQITLAELLSAKGIAKAVLAVGEETPSANLQQPSKNTSHAAPFIQSSLPRQRNCS